MENIKELAFEKVKSLNIAIEDKDELDSFILEAEHKLKILLNVDELNDQMVYLLSNMVAGFFVTNNLNLEGEFSGALRSLKEGDISASFNQGESLWSIAQAMCNPSEFELAPFRRIVW